MGYSHHWTQSRSFTMPEWKQLMAATRQIFRLAAAEGIALAGPEGEGETKVADHQIAFNGINGQSCESFILERCPVPRHGRKKCFDYCKTEHCPYDRVVVSVLAAARKIAPDAITIKSDGGKGVFRQTLYAKQ